MDHDKHQIVSSGGIRLIGPAEEPGQSRYHWIAKSGANLRTMFVRFEKQGSVKERDHHSPIVEMGFAKSSLVASLSDARTVIPDHEAIAPAGRFNPYLNRLQERTPSVHIPFPLLKGKAYDVINDTMYRGDFLSLASSEELIIINLWAVALFEGVDAISFDGTLTMNDETIGAIPFRRDGYLLPFFAQLPDIEEAKRRDEINDFAGASWEKVTRLLSPDRNPDRQPVADKLRRCRLELDKPGLPPEQRKVVMSHARETFTQMFCK